MDNAGNTSEIYKTANPYYTDPENKDSNEKDPAQQLPVDASATKPSSATAQVTDHTKTDSNGNTVSQTGSGTTSSSTGTSAKQSRVREILLRIPTRAVTARLLKKARNFIQSRLHQKGILSGD